ncbi:MULTISPECIES: DUF3558 domain-containing protein [Actinomycetes]|uniref:DUF3558 domain-containing protein n=1 Tax=Streptomyces sp. AA4 TaxID=591158 RepID=UPI001F47B283|nr:MULTISPECIES: DUF3558 domain-containing protein [Actinomycetes]
MTAGATRLSVTRGRGAHGSAPAGARYPASTASAGPAARSVTPSSRLAGRRRCDPIVSPTTTPGIAQKGRGIQLSLHANTASEHSRPLARAPRPAGHRAAARKAVLAIAGIAIASLSACTTASAPDAPARPSTGRSPGPTAPTVPMVQHPLDLGRLRQAPCDALTPDQADGLLGSGSRGVPRVQIVDEPLCGWDHHGVVIQVLLPVRGGNGIADIAHSYADRRSLDPIRGYPAIEFGSKDDQHRNGECRVAVGVNDHETIDASIVILPGGDNTDPCSVARDVLDKTIGNLQEHPR